MYNSPAPDMGMAHLGLGFIPLIFLILLIVWTLAWKGLALWHAARNGQRTWYIVLLVLNTFGILEIIYLLFFRADKRGTVVVVEETSEVYQVPNTTIVEEVVIDE
jgi:hypothetical protein